MGTTEAGRKTYLAARYSRAAEMRGVRDVLEASGHEVVSSWIDAPAAMSPAQRADLAASALEEIRFCDVLISFTGGSDGERGGRHAEFGAALVLGKRLVVAGPREHVFHDLPQVEWYLDWAHLAMTWAPEFAGQAVEQAAAAEGEAEVFWPGMNADYDPEDEG